MVVSLASLLLIRLLVEWSLALFRVSDLFSPERGGNTHNYDSMVVSFVSLPLIRLLVEWSPVLFWFSALFCPVWEGHQLSQSRWGEGNSHIRSSGCSPSLVRLLVNKLYYLNILVTSTPSGETDMTQRGKRKPLISALDGQLFPSAEYLIYNNCP